MEAVGLSRTKGGMVFPLFVEGSKRGVLALEGVGPLPGAPRASSPQEG
jgi:hypothetical protein